MRVLGVHCGHDSAAALVVDGHVVAHAAEERFSRVKHYGGIPVQSVRYCLARAGSSIEDVDVIATTVSALHPSLQVLFGLEDDEVTQLARKEGVSRWSRATLERAVRRRIRAPMVPPAYLKFFKKARTTEIVRVDHHLAHAASAYFTCGLDDCLVVTADGIGDGTSTAVWRARAGRLEPIVRFGGRGSFGWFYGMVTEALGWQVGEGEGKTMGLAPYGDPDAFPDELLAQHMPRYMDGDLAKPVDFGQITNVRVLDTDNWHFIRGEAVADLVRTHGAENVAAKAQRLLEMEMLDFLEHWIKKEDATRLTTAGGVFLNVKLNQGVIDRSLVEEYHIFPDAGDPGLPVGSAMYAWQQKTGERQPPARITDVYWGPEYSQEEIEATLRSRNLPFRRSSDISKETAELIAAGKIVGWFQGRGESGPRALGGRSILMDPRRAENKDIINARVKYREPFRPFCPSMTREAAKRYLNTTHEDRFMICASSVTGEAAKAIPAVVHVDNTVRPQVVGDENGRYRALIEHFGALTGVPVVLNTSFNIKGEPIVSTPAEAIRCFFDTGMDVLALGDFLVTK